MIDFKRFGRYGILITRNSVGERWGYDVLRHRGNVVRMARLGPVYVAAMRKRKGE